MDKPNNIRSWNGSRLFARFLLFAAALIFAACGGSAPQSAVTSAPTTAFSPAAVSLQPPSELFSLCWVAFTPTNYDPEKGVEPSEQSLRDDLQVLHEAGFNGLVTYTASGAFGSRLPDLAQEAGFQGLIMGVWDPTSRDELDQAAAAAAHPILMGYVVGNEGLDRRYDLAALQSAMDELRRSTNRPVATSEEIGDYANPAVLELGDWVFANAHPFWAGILDPAQAVSWTERIYADLQSRTNRPVMLKEVGMPTGGDPRGRLNESIQAEYYRLLSGTPAQFVYFESFDQPWKNDPSVEPFWGLFQSDRTPKQAARFVCGKAPSAPPIAESPPTDTPPAPPTAESPSAATPPAPPIAESPQEGFNIYTDSTAQDNHFFPSGYMGDTGDIQLVEVWTDNPHSGSTAIKVTYVTAGKGPGECDFEPPCKWAGVYWLNPANNFGEVPNAGYDLREYTRLTFWARSDSAAIVEFKVGGVSSGPYPSSISNAFSSGILPLQETWKQYEIPLAGADLSYVIDGFLWATNWGNNQADSSNPKTLVFYLDDIRFEK